ncbi:trypsin Blo t 3-like [Phymastichus coffea]|uniref:trypsin Blo t 3-like n=1 Tax=Phymastichus coffea TaxID=108790 RepID=UPI00273B1A36|nr:trypsin Blo t 3-like [Phymastichus coffea]
MSINTSSLILLFILTILKGFAFQDVKRILNGYDVAPREIPYQVSLQYGMISRHFCSGSIINNYYIVTAGHCIKNRLLKDIVAVVGTTNLNQPKWTYKVIHFFVHNKYKVPNHFANDIALLKVDRRIVFNEFVSPVRLPKAHEELSYHQKAVASGWGMTSVLKSTTSVTLKKVEVTIVDQVYCSNLYGKIHKPVYPVQFCTHDVQSIRKATCFGDSGGPITFNNVLIGIVSWSHKDPECGSPKFPDVHTRVSEYIDWIKRHAV